MQNRSQKWLSAVAALALFAGTITAAYAQSVVVPGAQTAAEGNSNNGFPFNITPFGHASMRYQQVYGAAEFAVGGPIVIHQIVFRPDGDPFVGGAFASVLPNVQIDLSTTGAAVDGLNPTFAVNVGANNQTVFSGALALSSSYTGPAGGPKDFDIVINLSNPFVYDPSQGNLLLDVRNFGAGTTTQFDSQQTLGDQTSRIYAFNVGSLVGTDDGNSAGLVTKFNYRQSLSAVPEPASMTLLTAGLAPLALRRFRRRKA